MALFHAPFFCLYLCTVNERERDLTVLFDLLIHTMETKILKVEREINN